MSWKYLFTSGQDMSPVEARAFMKKHPVGEYQLLDVRQPKEYERKHLPGAIPIPMLDLFARISELDPQLPTLVYCHCGMRSKAACQVLKGHGFRQVIRIRGGIRAWNDFVLSGHETKGMEFFISDEFENVFQMAYMMEAGLKQFYLAVMDMVAPPDQKALLKLMADFEDGHMAKLLRQYRDEISGVSQAEDFALMEGGFDREKTLLAYSDDIESIEDIIHLGMMLETQAYDLYSRLARLNEQPRLQQFYRFMADEEKMHLNQLSRALDKVLAGQNLGLAQV